jgi:acyl-CoA synthetase (AMP-forming)/AMP-acid ligase II
MKLIDPSKWQRNVIREGNNTYSPAQIQAKAAELRRTIEPFRGGRLALIRPSAALLAVLLAAIGDDDFAIVLLRSQARESAESLAALQIAAVVDEVGNIHQTGISFKGTKQQEVLMETSGTTGRPKVITHSLRNLSGGVKSRPSTATPARWLLTYPVSAFAGLQVLLTALASGDELITVANPGSVSLAAAAVEYKPTHMSATPTFWRSFVASCGPRASTVPLRQITLGGEIADQHILDLLHRSFPDASLTHIYASTEAGSVFSVKDGRAGFPADWLVSGFGEVRLRITDGVLEVDSPRAMLTKEGNEHGDVPSPKASRWIRTGDLVRVRGDRIIFLGREDTLINVGGSKVIPEEVEDVLLGIPGVLQARVYGCPNPITGNIVCADVVMPGPEDTDPRSTDFRSSVRASLVDKLERYKQPRIIRFLDQIAYSDTGKTSRSS